MPSFGVLHRVALVRSDVSEENIASIIRVKSISELGIKLAVTSNLRTLRRNTNSTFLCAQCVPSSLILLISIIKQTNSVALSPQANYTD
jgi:hypothetical protein